LAPSLALLALLLAGSVAGSQAPREIDPSEYRERSVEELVDVVAPVALYPDSLLGHVLAASTRPNEIAEALERLEANDGKPDEHDPVLQELDSQVQALLPFTDVLSMLNQYPDWTRELGDAMAFQEKDVLEAVQVFRKKAKAAGNLESGDEMKVIVEQQAIRIEAPSPEVVYVPVYQPAKVVVQQPDPVVSFAVGVAVGSFIWHGWRWGWGGCYWRSGVCISFGGGRWYPPPYYRPVYRPPHWRPPPPHYRPPGYRPPGHRPPGHRPPVARPPVHRPPSGQRPPETRPPGQRPTRPVPGTRPANTQRRTPNHRSGGAFQGVQRGSSVRRDSARGRVSRGRAPAARGGRRR
jgi:hypothetical protein